MAAVLTESKKEKLLALLRERDRRARTNLLSTYQPYPKQIEFHHAGQDFRERCLMAGNQLGKTWSAGFEMAMHLTGRYPDWWTGRKWAVPIVAWCASETMEVSRDAAQRILLGRDTERGTGAIPGDDIIELKSYPNVAGAVTMAKIRHLTGGISIVIFKSYDQGRQKFQGDSIDIFWPDEEPPESVYTEGLTRTNATNGIVMMTYTPLLGMSNVTKRFLMEPSDDRIVVKMTIDDALHYTQEKRDQIIASYPEHEREARTMGIPVMGSGKVFPITEARIKYESGDVAIQPHWARISGIDFGWDHPTGWAALAWDRDSDVIYVYDCFGVRNSTPIMTAGMIRPKGDWIPIAWPHDGLQHDKGSGEQLAEQYRSQGLNMLPNRVTFEDGTNGVEAGIMDMYDRMQTGRLKVASHLTDFWSEFRLYHRKDGKIVKENDDVISAVRYAIMGKRYAVTKSETAPLVLNFRSQFRHG
jgi:phage terminase large subunit-like protein